VVVAGHRLGQPGAGDVAGSGGDLAIGQGAIGRLLPRRRVDEDQRHALALEFDFVPKPAALTCACPATVSIALTRAGVLT
jgi:hypothetical protein